LLEINDNIKNNNNKSKVVNMSFTDVNQGDELIYNNYNFNNNLNNLDHTKLDGK